jgi:hypothetical protein
MQVQSKPLKMETNFLFICGFVKGKWYLAGSSKNERYVLINSSLWKITFRFNHSISLKFSSLELFFEHAVGVVVKEVALSLCCVRLVNAVKAVFPSFPPSRPSVPSRKRVSFLSLAKPSSPLSLHLLHISRRPPHFASTVKLKTRLLSFHQINPSSTLSPRPSHHRRQYYGENSE